MLDLDLLFDFMSIHYCFTTLRDLIFVDTITIKMVLNHRTSLTSFNNNAVVMVSNSGQGVPTFLFPKQLLQNLSFRKAKNSLKTREDICKDYQRLFS